MNSSEITCREDLRAAHVCAQHEPTAGLDAKIQKDGCLSIIFRSSETGIGRIIENVRDARISIADLSTRDPDLEDVFVEMTKNQD
tara:strand:- start:222 stop:476 length:255 start_codon:yes stop_codon:yes gene_type:complete